MKTLTLFPLAVILAAGMLSGQDLSVREQLENLNSYWKGKNLDEPVLEEKIPLRDDVSLIQMHLSLVEKTLRAKDVNSLSSQQQENRNHCLDILHDYWTNGIFPINTGHKERTPYFIDNFGIACAVGQLVIETGFESVAKKIYDENNYAYIRDLNQQYPELQLWADANGFEMDELAWIQPGYCFNPCADQTVRHISCYEAGDGCIGAPDLATIGGVPPYTFQDQYWDGAQWAPYISMDGFCNLIAGQYRHLILDSANDSFFIEYTLTQPDSITIGLSSTDDPGICHGSALAQASGGTPPFSYSWSRGDSTQQLSNVCYGTYWVTVTDANGCAKAASIIVASLPAPSTTVTHGPIIGGVTHATANVFVRTATAGTVTVELSADNFATIAKSVTGATVASRDSSNIFNITGLSPGTQYAVRAMIDGQESGERSVFKTFPAPGEAGHYKLLFGSCQYELMDNDSSLFVRMKSEDADIFTPTGDWGYPDKSTGTNDLYFSNPPTSWAVDYAKVQAIYRERYASTNSAFFLRSIALDYTHDDHDYTNDNSAGNYANIFDISFSNFGEPKSVALPPQARDNCLKGYREMFPSYPLPDSSEGIFHSYVMGNCEVFVLDTRSARSPQHDAFVEAGGEWLLQEPAGHSILGQTQMNWLLNGLQNSTADWKIIVSSVTFNKGYQAVFDSLLSFGKGASPILGVDVGGTQISTGLIGAGQLSDLWAGFPSDQNALLNHIETHQLKNIFIVSGDAHSAALDDGTNSGIPELMSANLKKANSEDPLTLSNFIGYSLWNKGASGMGNQNFNSTYGKMEVFGKDSIRLSAVDADGFEVTGYTFKYEAEDTSTGISDVAAVEKFKVYPNPASSRIVVESESAEEAELELLNSSGKKVAGKNFTGRTELEITELPVGIYLYRILDRENKLLQEGKVSVAK